jgi:DNA-binding NtrC family response regulator
MPRFLRNPTVLVVDDESAVARLTQKILQSGHFKSVTANSAEEAKQLFALHADSISVLITDVVMAGQSGPELAAELTGLDPALKVLLVSGNCDSADVERFPFLRKPFSATELSQNVLALTQS